MRGRGALHRRRLLKRAGGCCKSVTKTVTLGRLIPCHHQPKIWSPRVVFANVPDARVVIANVPDASSQRRLTSCCDRNNNITASPLLAKMTAPAAHPTYTLRG
eukprot:scaffold116345_cov60-Phaeocystis_antarctica.AAC.1